MDEAMARALGDLPPTAARAVSEVVAAAHEAFGPTLRSAVLFGSAAEGRLRPTSDVNLVLVLGAFDPGAAAMLPATLRLARTAAGVSTMFLLDDEIGPAAEAFASKFEDIRRRHRVLFGPDPFANLAVPRSSSVARLRQVLLNLRLRWRALLAEQGDREEALSLAVAEAAGPLRAAAALLLELEGKPATSPKEALQAVATAQFPERATEALSRIGEARTGSLLPPGSAGIVLAFLLDVAEAMGRRVAALR